MQHHSWQGSHQLLPQPCHSRRELQAPQAVTGLTAHAAKPCTEQERGLPATPQGRGEHEPTGTTRCLGDGLSSRPAPLGQRCWSQAVLEASLGMAETKVSALVSGFCCLPQNAK